MVSGNEERAAIARSPHRRRIVVGAAVVILLLALLVYLAVPWATEVQTVTVSRSDAVRALAINGRIRPRQSVEVKAPVSGTLIELSYDVGDRVPAGTVIARIDDGPQRAAISEAAAATSAQQAVVAQARRDLARFEALGQFVTRQRLEQARLAVDQGSRELQRLRASLSEAREVQQRFVIRAPFAGVILERPVDQGQTVGPEDVLYRLANLDSPEVTVEVDEAYAAELSTGTMGSVKVPGREHPLRATVVHLEPRVDETTGAREVRLRLVDPIDFAPSGQTVSINLIVERRRQAITIPRSAILQPESNPRLRIVDADGRVAERAIQFLDWPAADVIVTRGLNPGTRVLVDPEAAEPGTRVKVRK